MKTSCTTPFGQRPWGALSSITRTKSPIFRCQFGQNHFCLTWCIGRYSCIHLLKILPTNLGACKPTLYISYTSHLRWNSTMRHCFYHTDVGQQNAVFHNFAKQIAIIQYSGRSKHTWALAFKTVNNKELLCWFFILKWFNARHFEYSGKRCSLTDWKQSAQRLKLQERLVINNKINIIRWNIYRDDNLPSGRQVFKCL